MPEPDPSTINIFEPCHGANYHACIGRNSYTDFQTYSEGYFLSSKALLDRLIDHNKSIIEHDVLINPIVYSTRHGIELAVKYCLHKLNECDVKVDIPRVHRLIELWNVLKAIGSIDRRIVKYFDKLDFLVNQMDKADPDGQDFRYPTDNEGNPTQADQSIVDLINTRKVVVYMEEQLKDLCILVKDIVAERNIGSFTNKLSRFELEKLSEELPDIKTWKGGEEFNEVKNKWQTELNLSNNDFSRAVDFIKSHREFSGNIANYHSFFSINDDLLKKVMGLALKVKRHRIEESKQRPLGTSFFDYARFEKRSIVYDVFPEIEKDLTFSVVAEFTALFYLSRDGYMSERYEELYEHHKGDFSNTSDKPMTEQIKDEFIHVFQKTNFIDQVVKSLKMIGRTDLYDSYKDY